MQKLIEIEKLQNLRKTHDVGSGYPSDSKTVKFVKKYYKKNNEMPKFVRKVGNLFKKFQKIKDLNFAITIA